MNATSKCAHPACNCVPADGKEYCSDSCSDKTDMPELTCQCDHPECQGEALK